MMPRLARVHAQLTTCILQASLPRAIRLWVGLLVVAGLWGDSAPLVASESTVQAESAAVAFMEMRFAQADTTEDDPGQAAAIPARNVRADTLEQAMEQAVRPRAPSTSTVIQPAGLSDGATRTIESINVRNTDLRDLLRAIAEENEINLIVDSEVNERVTVRLSDVRAIDAIQFLCSEYDLVLEQQGSILKASQPEEDPPPRVVDVTNDQLTVDVTDIPIREFARELSEHGPTNVVVDQQVQGSVSGYLRDAPFIEGLSTLLSNNRFSLQEEGTIYTIVQQERDRSRRGPRRARNITIDGNLVSLDVTNAEISQVMSDIAQQMELEIITYDIPEGTITANVSNLTLEEALDYLFQGTDITYRQEGQRYVVGNTSREGMATSRMIRLEHQKAEDLQALLPSGLTRDLVLQVSEEQNAIIATGPGSSIRDLETFIREVDHATPQIMIEALVVDFEESGLFELAAEFSRGTDVPEPSDTETYSFNNDGGLTYEADGERVNDHLRGLYDAVSFISDGIRNIGTVPPEFFLKVRALSREGKANVISRPQISTLNTHPAAISIGTTQYYILSGSQSSRSPDGQYIPVQQERFERIEANITLDIVPYVAASGDITVDIRPEISTPAGQFNSEVPPTINTRLIESTVRLRDGETIVLGGLIEESEVTVQDKLPILGDIPLLGRLFRNRSSDTRRSELVIYITPHVFYGGDEEREKWEEVQDRLGLPAPEESTIDYEQID